MIGILLFGIVCAGIILGSIYIAGEYEQRLRDEEWDNFKNQFKGYDYESWKKGNTRRKWLW